MRVGKSAETRHGIETCDGFECADEDASGFAVGQAGKVQTVVHAVDEIDIRKAGRTEEYGVAGGFADEGVGGWVGESEVGLDFDDSACKLFAIKRTRDEFA